jgi:hypothetical protein
MTGTGQNLFAHTPKWKAWNGKSEYYTIPFEITDNLYSVTLYFSKKGKNPKKKKLVNFLVYDDTDEFSARAKKALSESNPIFVVGRKMTRSEKAAIKNDDNKKIVRKLRLEHYMMAVGYSFNGNQVSSSKADFGPKIQPENPNGK